MLIKLFLKKLPGARLFSRARIASRYFKKDIWFAIKWLFEDSEDANFYYDLTEINRDQLIHGTAALLDSNYDEINEYFLELEQDSFLKEDIKRLLIQHGGPKDTKVNFGRRVVWYAFIRKLKPLLVVETGVAHGVGSRVIAKALLRNKAENFPGSYVGTDIDPNSGVVFVGDCKSVGKIAYGDSIESLRDLTQNVDIFINDSDHSSEYEFKEYEVIITKLASNGVILGDNCHATDSLARFSRMHNRRFVFMTEVPNNHWYPGAGVGVSLQRQMK